MLFGTPQPEVYCVWPSADVGSWQGQSQRPPVRARSPCKQENNYRGAVSLRLAMLLLLNTPSDWLLTELKMWTWGFEGKKKNSWETHHCSRQGQSEDFHYCEKPTITAITTSTSLKWMLFYQWKSLLLYCVQLPCYGIFLTIRAVCLWRKCPFPGQFISEISIWFSIIMFSKRSSHPQQLLSEFSSQFVLLLRIYPTAKLIVITA
jgi:hypothetical protein